MKTDWKTKHIKQQPDWGNKQQFNNIINQIANYPNLVSIDEINQLKTHLINVSQGHSFILQGGDCAETFTDFSSSMIKNKLKVLLQMSAIIHYSNNPRCGILFLAQEYTLMYRNCPRSMVSKCALRIIRDPSDKISHHGDL